MTFHWTVPRENVLLTLPEADFVRLVSSLTTPSQLIPVLNARERIRGDNVRFNTLDQYVDHVTSDHQAIVQGSERQRSIIRCLELATNTVDVEYFAPLVTPYQDRPHRFRRLRRGMMDTRQLTDLIDDIIPKIQPGGHDFYYNPVWWEIQDDVLDFPPIMERLSRAIIERYPQLEGLPPYDIIRYIINYTNVEEEAVRFFRLINHLPVDDVHPIDTIANSYMGDVMALKRLAPLNLGLVLFGAASAGNLDLVRWVLRRTRPQILSRTMIEAAAEFGKRYPELVPLLGDNEDRYYSPEPHEYIQQVEHDIGVYLSYAVVELIRPYNE